MRILNVVGARPNLMKMAPIVAEMARHPEIEQTLLHTGQHYDKAMSGIFFEQLGLPAPDIYLGVGSGSHAWQTAQIMIGFERVCQELRPELVVVVGDVNSTLACSITAVKLWIPVAHVEAGLRSFDRRMPEEINRIVTDSLSDLLFTTSRDADENLEREGIDPAKVHLVGNVMIDALLRHRQRAAASDILARLDLCPQGYALLTLHRPSNVDDPGTLRGIMSAIEVLQAQLPVVFPAHPRTRKNLDAFDLADQVAGLRHLIITEPLGYLDFLCLMDHARLVLTDSGGVQEETTILGVPCLTLRENTERPVTITEGTAELTGSDPARILAASQAILDGHGKRGRAPELWDGHAAERIVRVILDTGAGRP
ncbi:MAG: UDP-N-acetylglucosamine 2-epimerase (non-hydrolyzing) [Anaerolineae bacterium]|nr:UDP-N-acetylglucosamine 2-epimerase (non-hydrolyzing) [Anaerolineae bacterium]